MVFFSFHILFCLFLPLASSFCGHSPAPWPSVAAWNNGRVSCSPFSFGHRLRSHSNFKTINTKNKKTGGWNIDRLGCVRIFSGLMVGRCVGQTNREMNPRAVPFSAFVTASVTLFLRNRTKDSFSLFFLYFICVCASAFLFSEGSQSKSHARPQLVFILFCNFWNINKQKWLEKSRSIPLHFSFKLIDFLLFFFFLKCCPVWPNHNIRLFIPPLIYL